MARYIIKSIQSLETMWAIIDTTIPNPDEATIATFQDNSLGSPLHAIEAVVTRLNEQDEHIQQLTPRWGGEPAEIIETTDANGNILATHRRLGSRIIETNATPQGTSVIKAGG